jgi:DNA helicase-2/ATP-dependent DNA helicase PcrA
VTIAPAILDAYPALNEAQRAIIGHGDGPLLVVAGPGSGKTFSLVLRAINLLVRGKAAPHALVLCTFTEKAAFELRDRLAGVAARIGYRGDLSSLRVGTIHGTCSRILTEHRHRTPLGNNHETLDELTQLLFIFEHFDEIAGAPDDDGAFLGRWKTRWTAIEGLRPYFDKITEEVVDPDRMLLAEQPFLRKLGTAYLAYRKALLASNRLDFAHLQRLVHDLLLDPEVTRKVTAGITHVLVDEYQDTNYIQEQVLLRISAATRNLCVVGDEDQALYRFRGATVRNILEFPERVRGCSVVKLTTNYRSHHRIVEACDRWMASNDWSNRSGPPFRHDKTIRPDPDGGHPDYPAVFAIWGRNARDEADRFATLVAFLKERGIIADYNQVALLLHSVRLEHSEPYIDALQARGIPAFCPRARAFFDNDEVRLIVGCLAVLFGYHGASRGEIRGRALTALAAYVDDCIVDLARTYGPPHPLGDALRDYAAEIGGLADGQALDRRPSDYFYLLLALDPFTGFLTNENRARNLATLSQLLNTFQNYYGYTVVTHRNRQALRLHLFNSFLRLLHEGGINEYEDPHRPSPKGYVQMMTIHQAKGLEFPVVVVGSLDAQIASSKQVDRDLEPYYQRPPFEPLERITRFDRMRLHYVAFSRAEKVLVLTAHAAPKDHFAPIWEGLPQWPYVERDLLAMQRFMPKERMPVKRAYSFTGDLKVYETCPRQYQFFRAYDFTPSRSATIFFGLLVHQTIEEIHRIALDGKLVTLDEPRIRALFDRTFSFLSLADVRPIGPAARETAFVQVVNYFRQNRKEMSRIVETEVDVSVEKDGYILTGKVDLLLGGDGRLELLDFKTSERPADAELLTTYEQQLCTYAHILERRHGKRPDRLLLYWTAEPDKRDALMEFPYRPQMVAEAGHAFDTVVRKIQGHDFRVVRIPERKVCKECDIKALCARDGLIRPFGRNE